jgi:hypothetical protein
MSEFILKFIYGKRVTALMVISSLVFWVVFCPIIRDGFNSVFKYFNWEFAWYGFLEKFSQLLLVQIFFGVICFVSSIHVLRSPLVNDGTGNRISPSWLIVSIAFLRLGNVPPYYFLIFIFIFIVALVFIAMKEKMKEQPVEAHFSIIVTVLVLFCPIIFLCDITSGNIGSDES